MRIGFIGFGEAASAMAAGLAEEGVRGILAFDVMRSPQMEARAAAAGVEFVDSLADLALRSDLILSMVTAAVAERVARDAAPHLRPGAIYADLNSCSPQVKAEIGRLLAEQAPDACYASVAVMSAVPPLRHRVPMVADGPGAEPLRAALAPYGVRIDVISGPLGAAATLKMCRSAILKGMEALFLEALLAAQRAGIADQVLASLDASFPDRPLGQLGAYLVERHGLHAERRAHEMQEAADTLASLGVEPLVARGAAERLKWSAARLAHASSAGTAGAAAGADKPSYLDVLRRVDQG